MLSSEITMVDFCIIVTFASSVLSYAIGRMHVNKRIYMQGLRDGRRAERIARRSAIVRR